MNNTIERNMSRIVVKNLPPKVTEEEIRQYFSKHGAITDLKLKYRDGIFRRFGFVGFCNAEEAEKSCQYFNGSFFKQSRITVEVCQDLVSDQKPQPWSKKGKEKLKALEKIDEETKKSEKKKKKKKKEKEEESVIEKLKDDSKFTEFLKLKEKGLVVDETKEVLKREDSSNSDDEEDDHEEEPGSRDGEESTDGEHENEEKLANKKEISDMDYLKLLKKKSVNAGKKRKPQKQRRKIKNGRNSSPLLSVPRRCVKQKQIKIEHSVKRM